MVLSLLRTIPPKRNIPSIEESLASISEALTKLTENQAAMMQQLAQQFEQTTTLISTIIRAKSNDHTFDTKTVITETTTEVITKTAALITNITKPENTMAQVLPVAVSLTAKIGAISNDLVTINTTTPNRVTTIIKTDTKVIAQTSHSPSNTTLKLSHLLTRNFSIHPSKLTQTYDNVMLIMDKLAANGVSLLLSIFIKLRFCWPKIFPPDHQCPPPKFVFLESELEPPWETFPWTMATSALRTRPFFRMGVLIRVGV